VDTLRKESKAALLRALCRKLERRGLVAGRIERILSARVPIIKFVERKSGAQGGLGLHMAFQSETGLACLICAVDLFAESGEVARSQPGTH